MREMTDREILAAADAIRAFQATPAYEVFKLFMQRYEDTNAADALDDTTHTTDYWKGRRDMLRTLAAKFEEMIALAEAQKAGENVSATMRDFTLSAHGNMSHER